MNMPVEWASASLREYLEDLVPPRPAEVQAMEAYAEKTQFPIIRAAAGNFCYLVTRMTGATKVFELGSGYGYSTYWFAKGVRENGGGTVHHVVWHADLSEKARAHLGALGYGDIMHYTVGEAVQALRETPGPFDLIFMDIDKPGYPDALPIIADKLRPGGALIVDNMLWHGQVLDRSDQTEATQAIRELMRLLATSEEWVTTLVPIRDGLALAYKQG
jgi:caffeoyl-CoA O-methyltransferase